MPDLQTLPASHIPHTASHSPHKHSMLGQKQRRKRPRSSLVDHGPMLTPLIDIMFLVLVFFMVHNSPAQRNLEVDVEPPYMPSAPETPEASLKTTLLVSVDADMDYRIGLSQNEELIEQWDQQVDGQDNEQSGAEPQTKVITELKRQLTQLRNTLETQGQFAQIERIRLRADYRLNYGQIIAICELLYLWPKPALLPLELDVSQSNVP